MVIYSENQFFEKTVLISNLMIWCVEYDSFILLVNYANKLCAKLDVLYNPSVAKFSSSDKQPISENELAPYRSYIILLRNE